LLFEALVTAWGAMTVSELLHGVKSPRPNIDTIRICEQVYVESLVRSLNRRQSKFHDISLIRSIVTVI